MWKYVGIALLVLFQLSATSVVSHAQIGEPSLQQVEQTDQVGPTDAHYQMDVEYDSQNHRITGNMKVQFKTLRNHKSLFFNVWGNAKIFREKGGGVQVRDVQVNGQGQDFQLQDTVLSIQGLNLAANQSSWVSMKFIVDVPQKQDRFGWDGATVSLGNWFPMMAVFDDEGWNTDPYFPHGESFYSLASDFDVSVTTDSDQVIATTGTEVQRTTLTNGQVTRHYQARQVRDFAMGMNPNYQVHTTTVDGIRVNVYYLKEHKRFLPHLTQSATDSIQLFNKQFGKYEWPELDIVGMEGWFGGMEYPQLVMVTLNEQKTEESVRQVNAHEIAHQWFYGMIGNNQYDEPWLDESFASYAEALYSNQLDQLTAEPVEDSTYHLSSPVSTFSEKGQEGVNAYYQMVYDYGARTLNDLRKEIGDTAFYEAMQIYFQKKKHQITTAQDFIDIVEQTSGRDLTSFFQEHRVYVSKPKSAE